MPAPRRVSGPGAAAERFDQSPGRSRSPDTRRKVCRHAEALGFLVLHAQDRDRHAPGAGRDRFAAPVPNDDDLRLYLLRVPLPGDDSDLEVITDEKYQKISEAFCTKDPMSPERLKKIDTAYKISPVTFGTPDAPKDPIGEARLKALGTADLTDKARNKLCEHADVRANYYKALVQQIKKAGTTPVARLQKEGLTAEDKKDITASIWSMRLSAFKVAFDKLLGPNEI
ncbi:hypothetical protein [Nocardia sp. NPDC051570]|uniref:hypothetical protein n=1 Tax=Nocardia sp. NPDC051570 TaxID=3364324 RepID=UPI0037AEE67A